jgi:hypothetical protein
MMVMPTTDRNKASAVKMSKSELDKESSSIARFNTMIDQPSDEIIKLGLSLVHAVSHPLAVALGGILHARQSMLHPESSAYSPAFPTIHM